MASLTTIKAGDIVECDVKGRRGYALVKDKQARSLTIQPITAGFTWRTVTGHQVITHFRRTKNVRKVGAKVQATGHDADQ